MILNISIYTISSSLAISHLCVAFSKISVQKTSPKPNPSTKTKPVGKQNALQKQKWISECSKIPLI